MPHASTLTPYTWFEDDGAGDCGWRRNDGAVLRSDPEQVQEFIAVLNRATAWLSANGFREPTHLRASDNRLLLHVVAAGQGTCLLIDGKEVCGPPLTAPVVLNRVTAEEGEQALLLTVRSDASGDDALRSALTGLMLSTLSSYEGFSDTGQEPEAWVGIGLARGFAGWWLGMREDRGFGSGFDGATERFGSPLSSGPAAADFSAGYQTGILWNWIAGWTNPDGFAYARDVIEGVGNKVCVYRIEGRTTGRAQLDGDAFTTAVDNESIEVREGMDTVVEGQTARESLREVIETFDTGVTTQPITIYWSPFYGAVETISGSGAETSTIELTEVRTRED